MKTSTLLKRNAIRLAKHHKKHCEGETCKISLVMLYHLLLRAGISVTKKERIIFI